MSSLAAHMSLVLPRPLGEDADGEQCMLNDALQVAVKKNDIGAATQALEAGAQPDSRGNLAWLAEQGDNAAMAELLLKAGADPKQHVNVSSSLLERAAELDRPCIVRALVEAGADIHEKMTEMQRQPLHTAAMRGAKKAVQALLQAGADIEAPDAQGVTPLTLAARRGEAKTLALLLEKGADPNTRALNGRSAAGFCAKAGATETLKMLLEAGANPDTPDDAGMTPMMYAAYYNQVPCLEALAAHGARITPVNHAGETAADLAAKRRKPPAVAFLQKVHAQRDGAAMLAQITGGLEKHVSVSKPLRLKPRGPQHA